MYALLEVTGIVMFKSVVGCLHLHLTGVISLGIENERVDSLAAEESADVIRRCHLRAVAADDPVLS